MSFADQARGGRSKTEVGRNVAALNSLLKESERSIREIIQETANIKLIVDTKLGTKKDDTPLRAKLKGEVEHTNGLAKETGLKIRAINDIMTHKKDELEPEQLAACAKIRSDFQQALSQLQKVTKMSMEKQKQLVATAKSAKKKEPSQSSKLAYAESPKQDLSDDTASESDSLLHNQKKQAQMQANAMNHEIGYNEAVIAEREEGIHEVEASLIEINQIMLQMSGMVVAQGQDLDLIEDTLDATRDHTVAANKELKQATTYQKSSRKKMCILLFLVLIVIGGLVIYFMTK
eukprot:NODE_3988_length_1132_cov_92.696729_g3795_i0.p1 GENE.NODE_3988_length_1132_cov_92.696729_g3795_i0~~NODE_3988_length_1132_cov_92.696729_g3795_i0.p1  ORF type:complete len:290 (+),score=63.70 NODE_3988_length_1132_cov_92.696729_g3795_i0:90-959(+)